MSVTLGWSAMALIFTVVAHGVATVWWASRITSIIDQFKSSIDNLNKELEKRDSQITAAWKQIDSVKERLTIIETQYSVEHKINKGAYNGEEKRN